MKIGILGGTFNPIHKGHIYIAERAKDLLSLDKMILLIAGEPPHKGVAEHTTRFSRLSMVKECLKEYPELDSSDFEILSVHKDYTYKTLEKLNKSYPMDEFYFIIGQDSLFDFDTWCHPEIISREAKIAVCVRKTKFLYGKNNKNPYEISIEEKLSELEKKYNTKFVLLDTEDMPISSSEIRDKLLSRKNIDETPDGLFELISEGEFSYIKEHRLYEDFPLTADGIRSIDFDGITETLKGVLKKKRFIHTLGVADTCAALAERYSLDENIARCAGLLHDNAKNISTEKYFEICNENEIEITPSEKKAPYLLHAKVGAFLAKEKYGIIDEGIIKAISVHTTGEPDMSLLSKILFIADYIEPNRTKAKNLPEIREAAYYDLDLCCLMILSDTLDYLKETNAEIDRTTEDTYNFYKKRVEEKRTLY